MSGKRQRVWTECTQATCVASKKCNDCLGSGFTEKYIKTRTGNHITQWHKCTSCDGGGRLLAKCSTCPTCKGAGFLKKPIKNVVGCSRCHNPDCKCCGGLGHKGLIKQSCYKCNGNGCLPDLQTCKKCDGNGTYEGQTHTPGCNGYNCDGSCKEMITMQLVCYDCNRRGLVEIYE